MLEKEVHKMAHMQKFSGASAHHIIGHCFREESNHSLKYQTTSEIDTSRSHLNRHLDIHNNKPHEFFENRKKEIGVKRKDQVTLIDWVITLPRELCDIDYDQQLSFFVSCANFVAKRYGEENLVGAYCHFDETTPHIHLPFMPIKDGKFQAKNIVNRADLNSFHTDLIKYLEADIDLDVDIKPEYILNGATIGGNTSVAQLKAENAVNAFQAQAEILEEEVLQLEKKKNEIQDFLADFGDISDDINRADDIKLPEAKNSLLGKTFSAEGYNSLLSCFEALKTQIKAIYSYFHKRVEVLNSELLNKDSEIEDLKSQNRQLQKINRRLNFDLSEKEPFNINSSFVSKLGSTCFIRIPECTYVGQIDLSKGQFTVRDYQIEKGYDSNHSKVNLPKGENIKVKDAEWNEHDICADVLSEAINKSYAIKIMLEKKNQEMRKQHESDQVVTRSTRRKQRDDEWEL